MTYKLKTPAAIKTLNFNLPTYYEIIKVRDGIASCEKKSTRDELIRQGYKEVGAEVKTDTKPEVKSESKSKAKSKSKNKSDKK